MIHCKPVVKSAGEICYESRNKHRSVHPLWLNEAQSISLRFIAIRRVCFEWTLILSLNLNPLSWVYEKRLLSTCDFQCMWACKVNEKGKGVNWTDILPCIAASDSIAVFHVNREGNDFLQLLFVSFFASPPSPVFNLTLQK